MFYSDLKYMFLLFGSDCSIKVRPDKGDSRFEGHWQNSSTQSRFLWARWHNKIWSVTKKVNWLTWGEENQTKNSKNTHFFSFYICHTDFIVWKHYSSTTFLDFRSRTRFWSISESNQNSDKIRRSSDTVTGFETTDKKRAPKSLKSLKK